MKRHNLVRIICIVCIALLWAFGTINDRVIYSSFVESILFGVWITFGALIFIVWLPFLKLPRAISLVMLFSIFGLFILTFMVFLPVKDKNAKILNFKKAKSTK